MFTGATYAIRSLVQYIPSNWKPKYSSIAVGDPRRIPYRSYHTTTRIEGERPQDRGNRRPLRRDTFSSRLHLSRTSRTQLSACATAIQGLRLQQLAFQARLRTMLEEDRPQTRRVWLRPTPHIEVVEAVRR